MVADRLEIVTRQDPQLEPLAEALKIEVNSPQRHLRIQRYDVESLPAVGTTMKVHLGTHESGEGGKPENPRLDVTGYLKDIAGFVEFPIHVEEDGKRTVIVHPDQRKSYRPRAGWEVTSLNSSFVWEEFFLPQDLRLARECYTEKTISIKPSASNQLFQGTVSWPVLNENLELQTLSAEGFMAMNGHDALGETRTRSRFDVERRSDKKPKSSNCTDLCRVYSDGILLPGVRRPEWIKAWRETSTFRIVLNIRRAGETKLELSRRGISDNNQTWSNFVFQRCLESVRKLAKQIVGEKPPKEALYRLARLLAYGGSFEEVGEVLRGIAVPLLVLQTTGEIVVANSSSAADVVMLFKAVGENAVVGLIRRLGLSALV